MMNDGWMIEDMNDYVVTFLNEQAKKGSTTVKNTEEQAFSPHYNSPDICAGGCSKIITLLV